MATEILRPQPQDCLSARSFHGPFAAQKVFQNRRRSRPARSNQASPSPNPKAKHGLPNPRSTCKSSSPPPTSTSPLPSTSSPPPPSTSPLSTSPVPDGFRLLRRDKSFQPAQPGSETGAPVERTLVEKKNRWMPRLPSPLPPSEVSSGGEKLPTHKKSHSDQVGLRHKPMMPPLKLNRSGSDDKELRYAGLYCSSGVPSPTCLPKPAFFIRSTSMGTASDDEASRILRGLLKLDVM